MPPSYATAAEFKTLSTPGQALAQFDDAAIQVAIDSASTEADGYLGAAFRLPLTSWGDDLKQHVCDVAAYRMLKLRGYNPDGGDNRTVRDGYDDAILWFQGVAAKRIRPTVVDSTPSATPQANRARPFVVRTRSDLNGVPTSYSARQGSRRGYDD